MRREGSDNVKDYQGIWDMGHGVSLLLRVEEGMRTQPGEDRPWSSDEAKSFLTTLTVGRDVSLFLRWRTTRFELRD